MPSKTIIAILCITAILITCIFKNIDGALLGVGLSAISGLGGWALAKKKNP